MDKTRSPLATGLLLSFAMAASGCASTASPSVQDAPAGGQAVSRDEVTVENLLRWALEGPTGAERASAGLTQVFELRELKPSWFSGRGPVQLTDGYILSFIWIGPGENRIDIGLKQEPCFSPERAVELTGAVESTALDMHGIDHGKTYKTSRNGIWIDFTTTPVTYHCVDSINVYPVRASTQ